MPMTQKDSAKRSARGTKGAKAARNINWERYEEEFPERYLLPSVFDSMVKRKISLLFKRLGRRINVLEIGANKSIRYYNKRMIENYYVFDRYVRAENKDVIILNESRMGKIPAELIVMRNSFNYLNVKEIKRLVGIVRRNKSILLFNTFGLPTKIRRVYKSKASSGMESTHYNAKIKKITHMLEPNNENYVIKHSFFYYPLSSLRAMFKGLKVNVKIRKNSMYVEVCG